MDNNELYKQLVDRYIDGTASVEELLVFRDLLNKGALDQLLLEATLEEGEASVKRPWGAGLLFMTLKKYSVAAAIVGLGSIGIFLVTRHERVHKEQAAVVVNQFSNDVAPGGNHATLTLANGTKITLDSLGKGALMNQGGARLIKIDSGNLAYKAVADDENEVSYNTIATPAGGQYQVTLSDGTRVWLNALSSIKFPTTFNGGQRSVELTGEAYFEVARDVLKPFHVNANGVDVEVLGTAFDVNAYADEPSIKTTLVQGAVRLTKANAILLLKPGEDGQIAGTSGWVLDKNADIDRALAWKNGKFSFEGADIRAIMRQIARWYDVEVRYQGDPGGHLFDGQIGRDLNLSEVLTGLSKSNVHFKIEGTVLTVLP